MAIRVKMENKVVHVREKAETFFCLRFNQLKPNHYEKKALTVKCVSCCYFVGLTPSCFEFNLNYSVLILVFVVSCCKYTIYKSFVKQNFQLFFVTFDNSLCVKQKKIAFFSKLFVLIVIFLF